MIPKTSNIYVLNVFGVLGLFLLAAFAILILYIPSRPGSVNEDIESARRKTLAEVNAKQHDMITTYEWVNKEEGVVRIPVDRAMKLVIDDLKTGAK